MAVRLTMTFKEGYLLTRGSGAVNSVQEALDYNTPIVDEAIRIGVKRILVDERNIVFNLDFQDVLVVAEHWNEQKLHSRGFRVATLPSPLNPEPQKGYETVANNHSMLYRVFSNVEDALEWLFSA